MPTSSPDASFTLEDLVGHEKEVALTPSLPKSADNNGHFTTNDTAADSYSARLDELLLDDDNSDSGEPDVSSPHAAHHDDDDDDEEEEEDEEDEDEGFIYTGEDAPEPSTYDAKLAQVLDGDSSSGRPDHSSEPDNSPSFDPSSELPNTFSFPNVQV